MGSAGISFFASVVQYSLSQQSRSRFEQGESRWSLEEQNDTCLSREGTQMQANNNNKKRLFLDELSWTKQM